MLTVQLLVARRVQATPTVQVLVMTLTWPTGLAWLWGGLYLASLPLVGWYAISFLERRHEALRSARAAALFFGKRRLRTHLRSRRASILDRLRALREEIEERLSSYSSYPPGDFGALDDDLDAIRDLIKDEEQTAFAPELQNAIMATLSDPQYGFEATQKIRFRSSTRCDTKVSLVDSFSIGKLKRWLFRFSCRISRPCSRTCLS